MKSLLHEFSSIRRVKASKKYILSTGENAGFYRDNCTDMIEEGADFLHILEILEERVKRASLPNYSQVIERIWVIRAKLESLGSDVKALWDLLPAELRSDLIAVDRPCSLWDFEEFSSCVD